MQMEIRNWTTYINIISISKKKKNDEKNLYSSKGKYIQNERPRQFNERAVLH